MANQFEKKELVRRYIVFVVALIINGIGVAAVTRANLGTSPISSVPYVASLNLPGTMGAHTVALNALIIIVEMCILGWRESKSRAFALAMQLPISMVLGVSIDFGMFILGSIVPEVYPMKIVMLVCGCAILAVGISMEVIANVLMASGEYFVQIVSQRSKKEFGNIKLLFDASLASIAIILSLVLAGTVDGIREGTIIAALITGPMVRLVSPYLKFIERWELAARDKVAVVQPIKVNNNCTVITISREYGSGGHEIGQRIAQDLGIKFYDRDLIRLVANVSGMSEKTVSEKEQQMSSSLLYQMVMQDYEAPIEKSLSTDDALFVAQSRVIRKLVEDESCVIVGRCADYILRERGNCINIFLHASTERKIERAVAEHGLDASTAATEIERINKSRATHYAHFTGEHWGDARNYDLTFDTSIMSDEKICALIEDIYRSRKN